MRTAADPAPWLLRAAMNPAPQPVPSGGEAAADGAAADGRRSSPGLRRLELGQALRELRERRGLRLEDVAQALGVAPSTLSRIETGKAPTRTSYLSLLLAQYEVTDPDYRHQLADLAREGQGRSWWTDHKDLLPTGLGRYLDLEDTATAIDIYAARTIPSLLQSSGYIRALTRLTRPDMRSGQAGELVTLHQRRKETLRLHQTAVRVVLDEAALRNVIGSAQVMAAQYEHLLAAADNPALTLQVIALETPCTALSPSFTILRIAGRPGADVACRTSPAGHVVFSKSTADVRGAQETLRTLARSAMPPADSADLIANLAARQH
jgi:transcriptional regulator with XRE-family HTH domain